MTTAMTENTESTLNSAEKVSNLGEVPGAVNKLRKRQKDAERFLRKIEAAEAKYANVKARIDALNQRRASAMMSSFRNRRGSLTADQEREFRDEEASILDIENSIDFEDEMIPAIKTQIANEMNSLAAAWRELRAVSRRLAREKFETDVDELLQQLDSTDTTVFDAVRCVEHIRDICEAHKRFYNYPGQFDLRTVLADTVINGEHTKMPANERFIPGLLSEKVGVNALVAKYTTFDESLSNKPDDGQVEALISEMTDMFLVPSYTPVEREAEWRSHETPAQRDRNRKYRAGLMGRASPIEASMVENDIKKVERWTAELSRIQSQSF